MIHVFVIYCMTLNPTMCQTIEIVPADGHRVASAMECMRAGGMSAAEFDYQGARWFTKGVRCREEPDDVRAWLDDQHE